MHSDKRHHYDLSSGAELHGKREKDSRLIFTEYPVHFLEVQNSSSLGFHPALGSWCGFGKVCFVDFCLVTVSRNLKRIIVFFFALESWGIWEGQVSKTKLKACSDRETEWTARQWINLSNFFFPDAPTDTARCAQISSSHHVIYCSTVLCNWLNTIMYR